MIPILYDQNETEFLTNGLGRLSDAISCYTEETRNGEYALSMVYPLEGIHFADISIGRLILASVGDGQQTQPFRISEIKRTLDGKKAEIYAPHISYDLNKMVALPFSASSAAGAFAALESAIQGNTHFTFSTDKTVDSAYALTKPMSVRAVLGGTEGSFTDVYGQIEYQFDRFKAIGNLNRGADRGVTIRYGKNLTKLENSDIEDSVYTAIIPYVTYRDASSAEKSIVGDMIKTDAFDSALPKIKSIDLSSKWTDTGNEPTAEQVTDLGKAYLEQEKDLSEISKSIKVSYIDLSKTEEYKGRAILEEVRLCDTVHVRFDALGVNATAKAVKIKYNVLLDRVEEVELGSAANNLSSTLKSAITQATADLPTTSEMEAAQRHAAELITGGLGGVIYVRRNANGQPIEIDICSALADGSLPASYKEATNGIWRWNANGLAYFDKYTDDPYTADTPIAITADGAINASLITTGELMAGLIKAGVLSDKAGNFYLDMESGNLRMKNGTFEGTIKGSTITGAHITGALMEGSTARFGSGNLHTTLSYGPSAGFGGHNALLISGNDRVAIESTQYQVRMTGRSVHVGTENDMPEASIYIGPSASGGNKIEMNGNVRVLDGRLLGYVSTANTEELQLWAFESSGHKYVSVYKDDSYFGRIQLS